MSDVEIEILAAIEHLRKEMQTVTVEAVQQALKSNPFFVKAGIETVPAEWIEPLLTDPDHILSDTPSTTMPPLAIGEQVKVINTPFIGTVEVMHVNFEDSGFTAYAVRMPRKAIEEGFDDLEIFDERLLTPAYQYAIGQTVYVGEGSPVPFTVTERKISEDNEAIYCIKDTRNDNQFWWYEYELTLTPMEAWLADLAPLVECPTCHMSIHPDQRLDDKPNGTCLICTQMSAGFSFAETQNTFYAVKAEWYLDTYQPAHCTVFYRTRTETRLPGYGFTIYQRPTELDKGVYGIKTNIAYVAFEQTLDAMFQKLKTIGYGATKWENLSHENFHHHMTHKDCNILWQAKAYGTVREIGVFNRLPEPDLSPLEDHPF